MAEAVVDASALVDLLVDNDLGRAVRRRIAGHALHAPAHVDAEVLSAVGRLHRAGDLDAGTVETRLRALAAAPIQRHPVNELLIGAWMRRHQLRLVDAVYVELAVRRRLPLVTTDHRLRAAPSVDIVTV
jgi:predicted nucleic acid-binding protein